MTARHTPGPWKVDRHLTMIVDANGAPIIGEDNWQLAASTPELLEALRTNRDYIADAASGGLKYDGSGDGFIAMAKEDLAVIDALIAKATGVA